jgi:Pro-kumamolisin, activation domain
MDKRLSLKSIVRREADPDYFHLYAAQGDLIVDPVVDTDTVCVANSIDLLAIIGRDLGIAPGSIRVEGSTMLLKRSEEHEAMLLEMKRERRGRSSTPTCDGFTTEDIAHCFGLTETDLEKTTSWMRLQGLESLSVSADRTSIRFSGDLLAVEGAFSTEFHRYRFEGRDYFASAYDLSVPRALAPVISGFRSLRIAAPPPVAKRKEAGVWKNKAGTFNGPAT